METLAGDAARALTHAAPDRLAFLALATVAVVASFLAPRSRSRRWLAADGLTVAALALVSAWPMFGRPFTFDATVVRVACAAAHPFGDWNHPPLSYLLSWPATLFSLEPWVMRIPQSAYCVAQALAILWAGREASGRPAGLVGASWYLGGIRARQGMYDLGDWDLAGFFVMAGLAWLLRFERGDREPGPRAFAALAAILALGGLASYLFAVPAAAIALAVALRHGRDPARRRWALAIGGIAAVLAARTGWLFLVGTSTSPTGPVSGGDLAAQMLRTLRAGQPPWMLVPLGLGLGSLALSWRRPSSAAVLLALVATPLAVAAAWAWSFSHGGYYLDLVAGVTCWTAGVGLAGAAEGLAGLLGRVVRRSLPVRAATAILGGVAFVACADLPSPPPPDVGGARFGEFAAAARETGRPIVTTNTSLGALFKYYRARDAATRAEALEALDPALPPAELIVVVDPVGCAAGDRWPPGPFHMVLSADHPRAAESPCWTFARARCTAMFPESWDFSFFDCPARDRPAAGQLNEQDATTPAPPTAPLLPSDMPPAPP
jgi:hypothetical protein